MSSAQRPRERQQPTHETPILRVGPAAGTGRPQVENDRSRRRGCDFTARRLLDQDSHLAFVFGDPGRCSITPCKAWRRISISVEKPAAPGGSTRCRRVSESERAGVKAFAPLVLRTSKSPGMPARRGHRGVQHPAIPSGAEQVNLGDRVLGPPPRPEPVGDRHEVGLEDRFQHQLQRRLNHPVSDGRDARACASSRHCRAWGSSV